MARTSKNRRFKRRNVLDVKVRSEAPLRTRWRRAVTTTVLSFAVLFGLYLGFRTVKWGINEMVCRNTALAVRTIEVTTDGRIPREHLLALAGVKKGDNLFALNLDRIKRRLERMPLIRSASVQRVLLDTLRISVSERRLTARVPLALPYSPQDGIRYSNYYVDSEGYVIRSTEVGPTAAAAAGGLVSLTVIEGIDPMLLTPGQVSSEAELHEALGLIAVFQRSSLSQRVHLTRVDLSPSQMMLLHAETGGHTSEIVFGFGETEAQLNRWRRIHEDHLRQGRRFKWADVSLPDNCPVIPAEGRPEEVSRTPVSVVPSLYPEQRHV